jgi:hypothetical protein
VIKPGIMGCNSNICDRITLSDNCQKSVDHF